MISYNRLAAAAANAKKYSYAPYSGFHVGAALLGKSGKIWSGCNIENAAFSPTNCAERTAVFKAVSEGEREFQALAVISDSQDYITPCGVCRQVLAEFCSGDFQLVLCKADGTYRITTLAEILPDSFGKHSM